MPLHPPAPLPEEARADLIARGYNRRDLGRIAAVFGLGAVAARAGTPAWAAPGAAASANMLHLDANECWTGPFAAGQEAARAMVARSNRYEPADEHDDFIREVARIEGVPFDWIAPWPGSSDPLCRAVVSFCSPTRGLVTGNPTFELAWRTAEWLGAPLKRVPLTADHRHDVRAMLAADPRAGVYYVCTPNNPTGTVTPLEDLAWLVANKPAGAKVLVDEAYIHWAGLPSAVALLKQHPDVMVLRTFSKMFGMAGMRMGFIMARPEVLAAMMRYDGGMQSGSLPLPSLACARASLSQGADIARRRAEMEAAREVGQRAARAKGLKLVEGSRANMFMIDWGGRTGKAMQDLFRAQGVEIGRSWDIWPGMSRITVGSMAEMEQFATVLGKIV
ncbi:MAG: aminotransferase class I/II-fold pyridoxal phosphate-dependent enzyme [Proteobacteria bacterium]|nr:aminotransferase class I/II-fold pyridoxal phosphate-dependent enzyme [Pseudomonadota bacterium]